MFTLYQKRQFIHSNKVNSPLIRQFPSFSILVAWHVREHNFKAQEDLKIYFWRKIHFVPGIQARDIANQSTDISDADLKPLSFSFPSPSLVWYSALSDDFWPIFTRQMSANIAGFVFKNSARYVKSCKRGIAKYV